MSADRLRLKEEFRRVGVVMDLDRVDADTSRVTEFFRTDLLEQLRRVLSAWGAADPVVMPTTALFEAAVQRRTLSVQSLVNFGTGLNDRFRFGQAPMAIEMLGLPYSGPNPFSVILCRDKHRTKAVVRSLGIQSPPGVLVRNETRALIEGLEDYLFPVLVKPNDLGNSIGIEENIADDISSLRDIVNDLCPRFPDGIVVEKFISGLEVTVMMLGNPPTHVYPLGMVAVDGTRLPERHCYTFALKTRTVPLVEWRSLSELIDSKIVEHVANCATRCWQALDCRDAARFDFRLDDSGGAWFIEANGQPELSKSTDYVQYLNAHRFAGDRDGLIREYLATFLDRVNAFIPR